MQQSYLNTLALQLYVGFKLPNPYHIACQHSWITLQLVEHLHLIEIFQFALTQWQIAVVRKSVMYHTHAQQ